MIDVLFFAELRDAIGKNKLSIEAEGYNVRQLKDKWLAKYELETIDNAMIAVNEQYANENDVLNAGDVVAFIPPVSGG